ncbi:hypothetical protein AB6A40_007867 [Gnathostoma spinigerum]|uniref:Uncharacterized protein n=1 Tax=Gnathostoma spinigerum TaxID=75299 RepID=A0ABD6EMH3_9BILA
MKREYERCHRPSRTSKTSKCIRVRQTSYEGKGHRIDPYFGIEERSSWSAETSPLLRSRKRFKMLNCLSRMNDANSSYQLKNILNLEQATVHGTVNF